MTKAAYSMFSGIIIIQIEVVQEPNQQPPNTFTTWKQQKSARRADHINKYARYIREPPVPQDHIKQGAYSWWLEER
jgi:hypothetical protein